MKIKCPRCGEPANLDDKFEYVECPSCSLKVSYAEYVDILARKEHLTRYDWRDLR